MKPVVAIVGRPNVGKSALFNRLIQKRLAIVEDTPGVTRDRLYADAEWSGREFTVIDTGGLEFADSSNEIAAKVRWQVKQAVDEADLILFVADAQDGITPLDEQVAEMLRPARKPIILVVNKAESPKLKGVAADFYKLGLGEPLTISVLHGLGMGELLDEIIARLPAGEITADTEEVMKIALVGRPNVGKSSLLNAFLGEERVIVSDIPGTTRDAIDVLYAKDGQKILFIDTAGMRRKAKVSQPLEYYSVIRALRAVDRADVVLILIDAVEGVTEQDKKIAGYVKEAGKAAVLVINKWDLIEKDEKTMANFEEGLRYELAFLDYAPSIYVSAKTKKRVHKVLELAGHAFEASRNRVATPLLNQIVSTATRLSPPPSVKGKPGHIYYVTQGGVKPPTFVFFVNNPDSFHFSYRRYLENALREHLDFKGTPVRLVFKRKDG